MLRLGFIAGLIAGAVAAVLLAEPKTGDASAGTGGAQGIASALRRQLSQAQRAARDEQKAKEAAMLADFEHARRAAERNRQD